MNFAWAVGGSTIVSPMSQYLMEPVFNEETIIYAECPATMIKAAKVLFDSIGHYSRPDLLRLQVRRDRAAEPALSTMPSRDLLRRIAETYEISEETLAAIVVELQKAS
jgi:amidase/nitrilase